MDFVDGPIQGLETGVHGEGAILLRELLTHVTRDEFVYVHEWAPGDLLIADNRNLLHCATWYDAEQYTRLMWRTTVMGNPGSEYAGESKTWIPRDGSDVMSGMENV
jgi:taurine dioxygenase